MLHLDSLARWARLRASTRVSPDSKGRGDTARMYAAIHQLFHERVLDACRRVSDAPYGVPDSVFVALPERLMSKIAYLCIGNTRSAKEYPEVPDDVSQESLNILNGYNKLSDDTHFVNFQSPPDWDRVKRVLLCHGLSPISDSILLLAEIGRAARLSSVTGLPFHVMLADISWMSSNRSIRQFSTLNDRDIDTGLRVCLDKRRRLYDALGATCDVKEIAPYSRQGSINREKLIHISQRYQELASTLWGLSGHLENEQVKLACTPLDQAAFVRASALPQHMKVFTQFVRALTALEHELKPHLEILRIIAKQFNTFDDDVFTYFFAQYYAQYSYRGSSLKIAVESEKKFDEPFDSLDQYFQTWGEGHSTTDMLSSSHQQNPSMNAIYHPQYQIGSLKLLPYTPLSLDALHVPGKDHNAVMSSMISLDDPVNDRDKILSLLSTTPTVNRNRLLSDLISFIMHSSRQLGEVVISEGIRDVNYNSVYDMLRSKSSLLAESWRQEHGLEDSAALQAMWDTWLKTCEVESSPSYIPAHIYFMLMDESDWDENHFNLASDIITLSLSIYQKLM
jgi:hypothetical protein